MEINKIVFVVWIFLSIAIAESQNTSKCKKKKSLPEGRTCRKACKTKADCKGRNKKCACDNVCGLSCFNPEAECPSEKDPAHGKVQNDKLTYGGNLTYSCDAGYELKGKEKRTCGSDRKWSGDAPTCVQVVRCEGRPEKISNGFIRTTKSEAIYSCGTGYKLDGNPRRKCQVNGTWSGSPPVCMKSGCPHPPRLGEAFASFPVRKTEFEIGDEVTYKCRFGFNINGNPNVTCTSEYTWSAAKFLCVKVSCGEPDKMENGFFEAKDFDFGTWVTYKCNKGYRLEDPRITRRYCATSGKWSGKIPSCEIKICPPPTAPRNGKVNSRSNTFGSSATYSCNQGYKLNGSSEVRCQDDGTWGELPICEVDIQCPFENPAQPLCGYKNAGRNLWKREFISQNRKGVPTYAIKYDGDATSAILRSPVIPDRKPHCVQFYFKPDGTLQSLDDLTIEVNGVRTRGAAPDGVKLPKNRWIGVQSTVRTEKSSFQFDIIAKGRKIVYIDDVKVTKGECDSPCQVTDLCQNGGICVDEIKTTYCSCGDRHKGQYCEREITCEIPNIENGRVAGDRPLVLDSKVFFDCNSGYQLRGASVATCTPQGLSKELPTCVETIKYDGDCPSGFRSFQLMCYRIFKTPQTYDDAKATCAKYGANLATVQSSPVDSFIRDYAPNIPLQYIMWIGLRAINNQRKWESGFDYSGTEGVENNLIDGWANYCAAYEYNFSKIFWWLRWRITYKSCYDSAMFVCETWKSSAKSYSVSGSRSLRGVYRPVNGLLTSSGRQVYSNPSNNPVRYLYHTYDQVSNIEGWFIGHYNIRGATAGYWHIVAHRSTAKYPNNIGSGRWRNRNNQITQTTIYENNWWTGWGGYHCDVTCGQGMQTRTRTCNYGQPGSMECRGQDREMMPCILALCRDDSSIASQIHMDNTYLFFPERTTWQGAHQACSRNKMELATITNRVLSDMLSSKSRAVNSERRWGGNFWVNGRVFNGRWIYSDGTTMVETDVNGQRLWWSGEPNGNRWNNDCVELNGHGGLNDHGCGEYRRFICQEVTLKNPCDRNPCRGNRVCSQTSSGYRCDCPSGLVEPMCTAPEPTLETDEKDFGACASGPCFGDAKCTLDSTDPSGFVCFCKSGWQGRLCDKERKGQLSSTGQTTTTVKPSVSRRNHCDRKPCQNSGRCVNNEQGYRCECVRGYSGRNCENENPAENPCKPDPCNDGGICKASNDTTDGFVCFCRIERKGKYCETHQDCKFESIPEHVELYRIGAITKLESTDSIMNDQQFELKCVDGGAVLGEQIISCKTAQWSRRTRIHCDNKESVCQLDSVNTTIFEVLFDDGTQVQAFPVGIGSGSSITFKCQRNGSTQSTSVTCDKGSWKTAIPSKCVGVTCSDVGELGNGSVIVRPVNSIQPYEPGTRLSFNCDSFYILSGATATTCKEDGSWSLPIPQCKESGCLLLDADLNSGAFVKNHRYEDITADPGDKYQLTCESDRKKTQTVTCMGKDKWKPPVKDFQCE